MNKTTHIPVKINEMYFKFLIVFISKYSPFFTDDINLSQYLKIVLIRNNIVTINKTMNNLVGRGTTLKFLYSFELLLLLIIVSISIFPSKLPPNKMYNNIKVMIHEIVRNEIDINFDIF
jgi:hypothetical protein